MRSRDPRLRELLVTWEEHYELGEEISVTWLCRDCPELVDEARREIEILREWNKIAPPTLSHAPAPAGPATQPAPGASAFLTTSLSDIHLYKRGGLGEVYRAIGDVASAKASFQRAIDVGGGRWRGMTVADLARRALAR